MFKSWLDINHPFHQNGSSEQRALVSYTGFISTQMEVLAFQFLVCSKDLRHQSGLQSHLIQSLY